MERSLLKILFTIFPQRSKRVCGSEWEPLSYKEAFIGFDILQQAL